MVHARKMRWLTYDPSADLDSPEQKTVTATAADDIWTPEQMDKFLDHVAAHRLGGCFSMTLLGPRREEVAGLRWSDVDLETGVLRIRQARVDVNGKDTIVATKTDRSARDLPLPPRELATLKAMRALHCVSVWPWGGPLPTMIYCCREPTGHGCRCVTARKSSPRSTRRRTQGDHVGQAAAQQHLADARGGYRRRCGRRLARPHRAHDSGGLRASDRRPPDRRVGGVLVGGDRTELVQTARRAA
jgi:hypothetical protein